jgi:hypothetical protein
MLLPLVTNQKFNASTSNESIESVKMTGNPYYLAKEVASVVWTEVPLSEV